MELYVGMDVSLKETSICVIDDDGEIQCEGTVISEPEAIAGFIKTNAVSAKRIGLETACLVVWRASPVWRRGSTCGSAGA